MVAALDFATRGVSRDVEDFVAVVFAAKLLPPVVPRRCMRSAALASNCRAQPMETRMHRYTCDAPEISWRRLSSYPYPTAPAHSSHRTGGIRAGDERSIKTSAARYAECLCCTTWNEHRQRAYACAPSMFVRRAAARSSPLLCTRTAWVCSIHQRCAHACTHTHMHTENGMAPPCQQYPCVFHAHPAAQGRRPLRTPVALRRPPLGDARRACSLPFSVAFFSRTLLFPAAPFPAPCFGGVRHTRLYGEHKYCGRLVVPRLA